MKFFVAFAAFVAVAAAGYIKPSILPTMVEDVPAFGPAMVEEIPGFGPAIIDQPSIGPAMVEHEYDTPAFGPAIIDFPINGDNPAGSPVVIGPIPEGVSPLVQIIVNVAGSAPGAGAVADAPAGDSVNVADSIDEPVDIPIVDVPIVDFPVVGDLPVSGVEVADLPAPPVSPVQIGEIPILPANIPDDLN